MLVIATSDARLAEKLASAARARGRSHVHVLSDDDLINGEAFSSMSDDIMRSVGRESFNHIEAKSNGWLSCVGCMG